MSADKVPSFGRPILFTSSRRAVAFDNAVAETGWLLKSRLLGMKQPTVWRVHRLRRLIAALERALIQQRSFYESQMPLSRR